MRMIKKDNTKYDKYLCKEWWLPRSERKCGRGLKLIKNYTENSSGTATCKECEQKKEQKKNSINKDFENGKITEETKK